MFSRGEHPCAGVFAGDLRGKLAQAGQATFADNAIGFFGDDAEHADDCTLVIGQRRIGKGVIGFLGITATLQKQKQTFIPSRLAALEHTLDARANVWPDFLPYFTSGCTQGPCVLDTERRAVSIVIEERKRVAPAHPHLVARTQKDADDGTEALRPRCRRPQRSCQPVVRAH